MGKVLIEITVPNELVLELYKKREIFDIFPEEDPQITEIVIGEIASAICGLDKAKVGELIEEELNSLYKCVFEVKEKIKVRIKFLLDHEPTIR